MIEQKQQARSLIRLAHLLFVASVLVSLLTGLRIYIANEPGWIWVSMVLPQGNVHLWHFLSGGLLGFSCVLYVAATLIRRRMPKLQKRTVRTRLFSITHYFGLALLSLSLLTGTALLSGLALFANEVWLTIHLCSAVGFVVYFLVHITAAFLAQPWQQVLQYFWLNNLALKSMAIPGVLAVVVIAGAGYAFVQPATLTMSQTREAMDIDGEAREAVWQDAEKQSLQTYQGYRQPVQGTTVTVQAAHDKDYAYFYLTWQDDTRSQTHLPLIKTEEGWQVLQTGAIDADENIHYEDKFALMLSRSSQLGGAGTVQLGHEPLSDSPQPKNQRGFHYTTDNSITDVWHWKSVRTGLSLGQADDNYFGPPTPSDSEYKRYTAGYQKDRDDCEHLLRWNGSDFQTKPECGGFVMNWELLKDGIVTPLRLPAEPALLKRLGNVDNDPTTSDYGSWWLDWDDTMAYSPDDDKYPVGTIMPSVLSLGPFSQGRGDVTAVGHWRDGQWHLEIKRRLETGSEYDLPIEDGMHLWVSTFDHAQTRHSYHLRPLKLEMGF